MADTPLQDQFIHDREPLTVNAKYITGPSRGSAIVPSSASAVLYDPLRDDEISGAADAAGTTTSFVSAALAALSLGDDFINGMPVQIARADGSDVVDGVVTDYADLTGTVTLDPLPWAVAASDVLTVMGYPLITQAAATVTIGGDDGNEVTIDTAETDAHSYTNLSGNGRTSRIRGQRVIIFYLTFSGSRRDTCRAIYNVLPR